MKASAVAAWAVVRRDARTFASYRLRFAAQMAGTVLTLALFYELARLISTRRFPTPGGYFDFAVVGLALLPALRTAIVMAPSSLRDELVGGTFEHFALSPFGPVPYLLCTLIFPLLIGMLSGAIILLLAAVLFHLHVVWSTLALAVPLALALLFAFVPFAALMLGATLLAKQVTGGAGWIMSGLSLLGGAYFPVSLLPGWIRWASDAQPLTPTLVLLRHVIVGSPIAGGAAGQVLRLALFAGFGVPIGAAVLAGACMIGRRLGTQLEY